MKAYPTYKDSGIEWLGEIPEHWEVKKLKHSATINPTKDLSYLSNSPDSLVTFLPMEKVKEDGTFVADVKKPLRELWNGFTYFREDDVIVAKITPCFENGKGAFLENLGSKIGFGSTEFHVLREKTNSSVSKYLYYLTKSHLFRKMGEALMTGAAGQKRVPTNFLEEFSIGSPPLPEQRAIAAFLDHKTRLIDTYVAKKQQQIERLQAYRTALINQAVTKGLNPDAPMKDSGIEWMGEIPAHWEIIQLKHLLYGGLVNGIFKKKEKFGRGVKIVNVRDIYQEDFFIKVTELERVEVDDAEAKRYEAIPGDIFFVRSSLKLEGVGVSACIDKVSEPTVFECHIVKIRPNSQKILSKYLISYLNSLTTRQRLVSLAETVTMATISQPKLSSIEVAVPPIHEQEEGIKYLDEQTAKIDTMIAKTQHQIDRLQAYRTALISDAVTGKIDVRTDNYRGLHISKDL